jgi:hypothetical protein
MRIATINNNYEITTRFDTMVVIVVKEVVVVAVVVAVAVVVDRKPHKQASLTISPMQAMMFMPASTPALVFLPTSSLVSP